MTGTVLFIALIHAIPVLLAGLFSNNKRTLKTTAIVMAVIAVISGNANYMAFDFVAIGLAYFLCAGRMEKKYEVDAPFRQTRNKVLQKSVASPEAHAEEKTEADEVDDETNRQINEMKAAVADAVGALETLSDPGFMWRPAAEKGNSRAQFHLGLMYHLGEEVPKDEFEAIKWYRLAAEQGDIDSQLNLGLIYLKGEGVPQDYHEAAKWLLMAANGGSATAQYNLGVMYEFGTGVAWDIRKACNFYQRAASEGHKGAKERLEIVESALRT